MVGRLLGKATTDAKSIGQFGAPSLFGFLLGVSPSLLDLEVYDSTLAIGLRNLLLAPVAADTELFLQDGMTRVNDTNKRVFVEQQVQHILVGSRKKQLSALKSGFNDALGGLSETLSVFSVTDLMLTLCGDSHIDGYMIETALRFSGWPSTSSTTRHLLEIIHELHPSELRRFLRFASSSCALPGGAFGGNGNRITVQRCPASERLPVGRTCFCRIDLPDYDDKELLRSKLLMALHSLDEAFTLY
jgi:hypothetical protein